MDLCPEALHARLIEVGLPSTVNDLTNPTQKYVLNLLTHFLNKMHIDVSAIKKPTDKQLTRLGLAKDNPEILAIVNISEAMASIGKSIFLQDFCLTDIMNPAPKRTRKIAGLLVNFVLYANNKMVDIEDILESTRLKVQELEALKERKNAIREAKSKMALDHAKKLERKEQLQHEIEQWKAKREGTRARAAKAEAELKATEVEKLKVSQIQGNLNDKSIQMRKKTEELESKIVRLPKRYEASLEEGMEQKKLLIEKLELIPEQIRAKRRAIEKIESYVPIVHRQHDNSLEVIETHKRITESNKEIEEITKKVAEMRSNIEKEATMYTQDDEQASNADLEKAKEQCEQSLSKIRKEHTELSNKKKALEKTLEDSVTRQQEMLSQVDKVRAATKQREDDTKSFVKNCQELYDAEIKKLREMQSLSEGNGPSEK